VVAQKIHILSSQDRDSGAGELSGRLGAGTVFCVSKPGTDFRKISRKGCRIALVEIATRRKPVLGGSTAASMLQTVAIATRAMRQPVFNIQGFRFVWSSKASISSMMAFIRVITDW